MAPDFSALEGSGLAEAVGALLTVVLICAVGSLVVAGVMWAWGHMDGNWQLARRGKLGTLVCLGAACLAGAGVALFDWLVVLGGNL